MGLRLSLYHNLSFVTSVTQMTGCAIKIIAVHFELQYYTVITVNCMPNVVT